MDASLRSRLEHDSPGDAKRAEELDERATAGVATDEEAAESLRLVWPYYFADSQSVPRMPEVRVSVALFASVAASIQRHFEARTLERNLPAFRGPFVLIHGEHDPLPVSASQLTAALVHSARVEIVRDAGHFPWLEQPARFLAAVARAFEPAGAGRP